MAVCALPQHAEVPSWADSTWNRHYQMFNALFVRANASGQGGGSLSR